MSDSLSDVSESGESESEEEVRRVCLECLMRMYSVHMLCIAVIIILYRLIKVQLHVHPLPRSVSVNNDVHSQTCTQ